MTSADTSGSLCNRCRVLEFDDLAWPGSRKIGSTKDGFHLDITGTTKYTLDFYLEDSFPGLPNLERSSQNGCHFCRVLKCIIQKHVSNSTKRVQINTVYYNWDYYFGRADFGRFGLVSLVAELEKWADSAISKSVKIVFDIDCDPGPCSSWLSLEPKPQENALCNENIQLIHDEIALSEIGRNNNALLDMYYPTRLVDVGDFSSDRCRLVLTNSTAFLEQQDVLAPLQYVALSYCWGPPDDAAKQFKTEASTLIDRLAGFSPTDASPVVQDVIALTRALGLKYLWVDALCIIQGNKDDWERESASMGLVYRHAHLTVATTGSSSCQHGFLERATPIVAVKFVSKFDSSIRGHYYVRFSNIAKMNRPMDMDSVRRNWQSSPWSARGWTFQESALSRRMLLAGRNKFYFLTADRTHAENDQGFSDEWDDIDMASRISECEEEDKEFLTYLPIGLFSRRELTVESDRLPAFSGMAHLAQDNHNDQYLAGLWKADLHRGLFWRSCLSQSGILLSRTDVLDHLETSYSAPSWSWASRQHGVEFPSANFGAQQFHGWHTSKNECEEIEAQTSLVGTNPFGEVTDGTLRITGYVVPVPSEMTLLADTEWIEKRWRSSEKGKYIAYISFDWNNWEPSESFSNMSLLLVGSSLPMIDARSIYDVDQLEQLGDEGTTIKYEKIGEETASIKVNEDEPEAPLMVETEAEAIIQAMETLSTANNKDNSGGNKDVEPDYSLGSEPNCTTGPGIYAWGIVIHPAKHHFQKYVRVGIFSSWPQERGGLDYFQIGMPQTVQII
ncbi:uncharacterized protein BP5553_05949 [Venustampulla echinocandica]|uniref:Heterokaryon incompatibility domain-containing protein n=1 Tax=Venustampulla echinocandica TaxID=2656787 RepID=A0A370TM48_9HELO|nr:uncharacterized protein BP5553_05949 [Venustampulla echinocandica]RDL36597.1 hypothetical protein BP5553_05949 [Venustampulla echinocandica]